jgi:hypothetical protein
MHNAFMTVQAQPKSGAGSSSDAKDSSSGAKRSSSSSSSADHKHGDTADAKDTGSSSANNAANSKTAGADYTATAAAKATHTNSSSSASGDAGFQQRQERYIASALDAVGIKVSHLRTAVSLLIEVCVLGHCSTRRYYSSQ